ncbi:MAG TPA: tRNA pseudouridine(38-40) synthase TruA [Arenimonas sp.]|jgi:tRNA pseudouridine38-40 synthase|nr:tRNA pseudouridine(38-40) synthase TruA [Arenimonas sp.]HPW33082.1 tRNA pseudouridine(38-40) synthase TruA [Arenimonas sp.]
MRYALGIEYDGSDFSGWQRLSEGSTVQAAVEKALSFVAHHPVDVVCSGRTDAGVHAQCQVIHFDSESTRTDRAWVLGTNSRLPASIRVLWCQQMPDQFHARYSARARRYRYTILNRAISPAMQRQFFSWERLPLDVDAMHIAAQALRGEHDFTTFRTVKCQAKHPNRDLQDISVRRHGEQVVVEVQANGFLHHMVRNIVGSLMVIGRGEKEVGWMAELLAMKDRKQAGPTAPAEGLVFIAAKYPQEWALPEQVTL